MEMKKSTLTEIDLGDNATTTVYICRWNKGSAQIEFCDYDSDGVWHNFKVEIPNKVARSLVEELVKDLDSYDEKVEKEAAEDAAEKAAEEAERIAIEQGVEDLLGDEETDA